MKRHSLYLLTLAGLIALGCGVAAAQFPITVNIPKLPKIKKDKPSAPTETPSATPGAAPANATGEASNARPQADKPPAAFNCENGDPMDRSLIQIYKKDIQGTLDEARSFTPGRAWYVHDLNDRQNEYLMAAISPSRRARMAKEKGKLFPCFEELLEQLAAEAKKSLPTFTLTGYDLHNPVEERTMKAAVSDIATTTVFRIGISGDWRINKNEFGIPTQRFKWGAIWLKNPNNDDGYCRIVYVNPTQNYSGGGTWGPLYGEFISVKPAGCPPGK